MPSPLPAFLCANLKDSDFVQFLKSSELFHTLCEANKVYVSLDILEDNIMIKGWDKNSGKKIQDILDIYTNSKIKGYIITDIQNDGMLKGLNLDFVSNFIKKINLIKKFNKKIIIAGGLTDYSDLINLKKLNTKNIEGIISGKSFYEGKIDLVEAQKILN